MTLSYRQSTIVNKRADNVTYSFVPKALNVSGIESKEKVSRFCGGSTPVMSESAAMGMRFSFVCSGMISSTKMPLKDQLLYLSLHSRNFAIL